ncbi:hypothetical protein DPMN_032354 [Dreissena polymorpha]|uniref:Uncharacterized protein n=1 Tax=Dreissena polymorpha TaxID=45954 RepID=A0A9D4M418_DREPO|nr:hypothetical protein DPMN_032354 [Dreissena polymorpha]
MTYRKFVVDICEGLVQFIQELYGNASSAVLLNGQMGYFFVTSVGYVRDFCFPTF